MAVTAKVTCSKHQDLGDGQVSLAFTPDYQDGRNSEWAKYTPALQLSMTVKAEAADHFEQGAAYTLTFEPSED